MRIPFVQKILDLIHQPVNDKLDSVRKNLNFYINHVLTMDNIQTMPSLKQMQLKQYDVLEKTSIFFKERNIKFFFYGGTLLGSLRHKGFIPWDDDIDLAILSEDFNKLLDYEHELIDNGLLLSSPFSKLGNYTNEGWDKIYNETRTVHISICCFDLIKTKNIDALLKKRLKFNFKARGLRKLYMKNIIGLQNLKRKLEGLNQEYYKNEIVVSKGNEEEGLYVIKSLCCAVRNAYMSYQSVFPLHEAPFLVREDQKVLQYPIPNYPKEYLENFYGKDYMFFPNDLYPTHRKD